MGTTAANRKRYQPARQGGGAAKEGNKVRYPVTRDNAEYIASPPMGSSSGPTLDVDVSTLGGAQAQRSWHPAPAIVDGQQPVQL